jgi:hypothetical protein
MTPEKAPISPASLSLPSDKFRKKEKPKELMPIPIVPFSQLRIMFESSSDQKCGETSPPVKPSTNNPLNSSTTSPTRPNHIPISDTKVPPSILKKTTPLSSTNEERSPMQLTEHFSNGELHHEPYKQRKPPGPEAVSSPQKVENDQVPKEQRKPHKEYADGPNSHDVQPKAANAKPPVASRPTPKPRQPKPAVPEPQSRKGMIKKYFFKFSSFFICKPVRIRVRIGPPHPLMCHTR